MPSSPVVASFAPIVTLLKSAVKVPLELLIKTVLALVPAPARLPPLTVKLPETSFKSITSETLLLALMASNVAVAVPLVKSNALPVPLMTTSLTVKLPNMLPVIAVPVPVLPTVKPLMVLLLPNTMLFVSVVTSVGLEPAAGNVLV